MFHDTNTDGVFHDTNTDGVFHDTDGVFHDTDSVFHDTNTDTDVCFRRLCDDDDELSEVEPDAVPSEVRDWLALTFTRSMSNMKRRRNQKPKFRSVAQAIRAGIMVDK